MERFRGRNATDSIVDPARLTNNCPILVSRNLYASLFHAVFQGAKRWEQFWRTQCRFLYYVCQECTRTVSVSREPLFLDVVSLDGMFEIRWRLPDGSIEQASRAKNGTFWKMSPSSSLQQNPQGDIRSFRVAVSELKKKTWSERFSADVFVESILQHRSWRCSSSRDRRNHTRCLS